MPVTVVVGGQFGSEGKGKVACLLATETGASIAIRIGGANSGHTVVSPTGNKFVFRHLPTACVLPKVTCIIGPGSYLDVEVLMEEIALCGIDSNRLVIDEHAMIIRRDDKDSERDKAIGLSIGSTLSGTGAAVVRRVWRSGNVKFAKHDPHLRQFTAPSSEITAKALEHGERVVVEGTQGFGLSLLHSPFYPNVTSRDTTAAAFLSEAGLSPLHTDDIVVVIRAFPIRVAGNSGPLPQEIDWETITQESGNDSPLAEYTSVTKQLRRVARFDPDIVRKAIVHNHPTRIVLNHLDYVDKNSILGRRLSPKIVKFVETVEESIGRHVDYLGLSPDLLIHRNQALDVKQVA